MNIKEISYRESDTKQLWESQCTYSYISHLEDLGYMEVKDHAGERRIFSRPAAVIVTFLIGENFVFYDAKEDILAIYGTKRITRQQAEKFKKGLFSGKIGIFFNKNGYPRFEQR